MSHLYFKGDTDTLQAGLASLKYKLRLHLAINDYTFN